MRLNDNMARKYIVLITLLLIGGTANAADWYVTTTGTGDGSSWANATNSIQAMLDGASSNDTVWVGAGTYSGNFTNYAGVTLRSSNNVPADVTLDGEENGIVVEQNSSSWLVGVTLLGGSLSESPKPGGGVHAGNVTNCIITQNTAGDGGGAYNCIIWNSSIHSNSAGIHGGGVYASTVYNSIISSNSAGFGGGASESTIYNSIIENNNTDGTDGGGVRDSTLYNCLLRNNTSGGGGGAEGSVLYNCTIVDNTDVSGDGGGVKQSTLVNCISWGNSHEDDFSTGTNSYSIGVGDDYKNAIGSMTNNPLFIGGTNFRLQATSPAIGIGNNSAWAGLTNSVDMDGNKRIWPNAGVVDIGAYEYGSQKDYPAIVPTTLIIRASSITSIKGSSISNIKGSLTVE